MADEITDADVMNQLAALAQTATVQEEKHNAHTFLNAVATAEDTTKVGFLKEEEVGIPKLSARTLKGLALYCKDIGGEDEWAEFFNKSAEILTSTSLSKDGFLDNLAIVQRREISNLTPKPRKINKGWFGRRKEVPAEM